MAKVHNRDHIAVLRGRFTLLPLLPLSRNRSNSSFFLFLGVTSLSQKTRLKKPGSPLKPETKKNHWKHIPWPLAGPEHWNSSSLYPTTPAPTPAPPALQVPWTPKHRTPNS